MNPYFTVIADNHNYARFLGEAVDSVLSQTCRSLQAIVVDDGSSDGSLDVLRRYDDSRMTVIQKENAGQLSCFNAAIPHARGEVVCFLDADDVFTPGYLQALRRVYEDAGAEYVFCNYSYFGKREGVGFPEKRRVRLGDARHLALNDPCFIGGPTSTISMRRDLCRKILPVPELEKGCVTQADDILAIGADVLGARKLYLPDPLVRYRVHGDNLWFGRKADAERSAVHKQAIAEFCLMHRPEGYTLDSWSLLREMWRSPFPLKYKSLLRKKFGRPGGWLAKCMGFVRPGPLFNDKHPFFRRFRL